MNRHLSTVMILPMTTKIKGYPTQVSCTFQGTRGEVVAEQIQTVDKKRLVRQLGEIDSRTATQVLDKLVEMFAR